uniref:BZIP domain-containing protein n=1 Tax=Kalmanozyma brasiliensis (strain GHG001) TaxID=1365824 RepID=V5GW91_KALBG
MARGKSDHAVQKQQMEMRPNRRRGTMEAAPMLARSPAASADDTEFYGAMIQMLTHVLGSSDSVSWPNQPTPGSQLAPSPFAHPYSSPAYTPSNAAASLSAPSRVVAGGSRSNSTNKGAGSKAELTKLQPMIDELIARLRKDQQQPTRQPVGEQDLTALLQTLMQQQQRQQDQQARQQGMPTPSLDAYSHPDYLLPQQGMMAPISLGRSPRNVNNAASFDLPHSNAFQPMQFADLEFEEEDEDDPDFNPDLNPDFPFPSAWSMAVQDVVASEESRAAAAAAAVAASHSGTPSGTQTPADVLRADPYRPGNLSLAGSMEHLAPRASSAAATGGRRPSFEPPPAESSRRPSQVQPSPSVQVASVPSSRPARNEDRWSPRRDASTPAPSFADARPGSRTTVPDHLMSPSGRPVRTSRKRPASPTPASPPRPIRMEAPAPSSTPPENEADAEAEAEQNAPKKRGRKAVLEPGEAARRRAQRNIEYQRARRQAKKAEESEQTETVVELKAEVRVLRAEIERLRDENATLRAQRELDRLRRSNGS